MKQSNRRLSLCLLCSFAIIAGCKKTEVEAPKDKPPRPVEVAMLNVKTPSGRRVVTATAASWKSEQIGFTVSGRVTWVAEPNTNVEGRVVEAKPDAEPRVIIPGDPIALIESETYRLQVEQAKAELSKAEQNVAAAKNEIKQSFPAKFKAAQADLDLAKIDRDRRIRLVQRDAGSQADADKAEATLQNALSTIVQLNSSLKAKQSEFQSLELQIEIAKQALKDTQIQLKDCTLYSSFRGQIADVSVVPGSFVGAGNPVATVQMMNPIKVEFEVSADESRRLRDRQSVKVLVKTEDGSQKEVSGVLYLVEPVADPETRTFTATVLVKNPKTEKTDIGDETAPAIDQVWPMKYEFLPGASEEMNFIAEEVILEDEVGNFVWKIDSLKVGDTFPKDRLLKVSKLRVEKMALQLPFLGSWIFRQIEVLDDSVDLETTLVAGKLELEADQRDQWNGNRVRLASKRHWQIRPGDLVQVDLSEEKTAAGLFVPMNAVIHQSGKTFLALVEGTEEFATVKRVEISVTPTDSGKPVSSVRQIEPIDGNTLIGQRYVTKGAHFLIDGQKVQLVSQDDSTSESSELPQ